MCRTAARAGGPCYQWTRKVKGRTVSVALSQEQYECWPRHCQLAHRAWPRSKTLQCLSRAVPSPPIRAPDDASGQQKNNGANLSAIGHRTALQVPALWREPAEPAKAPLTPAASRPHVRFSLMAAGSTSIAADPVRQSPFSRRNRVGGCMIDALLGNNEVHVWRSPCLIRPTVRSVRLIVDDRKARAILAREDFPYNEADILAVEITDESDLKRCRRVALKPRSTTPTTCTVSSNAQAGKSALALSVEDVGDALKR